MPWMSTENAWRSRTRLLPYTGSRGPSLLLLLLQFAFISFFTIRIFAVPQLFLDFESHSSRHTVLDPIIV